ncbi:hypothetical protein BH18ACT4_BH18ACT4_06470 [soil metagenome]
MSWLAMAVVAVVALGIGTFTSGGPSTPEARAAELAGTIKCPTCRSQSAADSDAPASLAIRAEINRRVQAGESDSEIRSYFASRYGEQILLTPSGSGLAGLVWVLPVVAVIVGGAGLAFAFSRWRRWAS